MSQYPPVSGIKRNFRPCGAGLRRRVCKFPMMIKPSTACGKDITMPLIRNDFSRKLLNSSLRVLGADRLVHRLLRPGFLALGERKNYAIAPFWRTADWFDADLTIRLEKDVKIPLPDRSQKVIYSAHMLEHVQQPVFEWLMQECYRLLQPGGIVRFELPDSRKLLAEYHKTDSPVIAELCQSARETYVDRLGMDPCYAEPHAVVMTFVACWIDRDNPETGSTHLPVYAPKEEFDRKLEELSLDDFLDWCVSFLTREQLESGGHVNGLYYEKVQESLAAAGFRNIREAQLQESAFLEAYVLEGIERTYRAGYSFFIEARKDTE